MSSVNPWQWWHSMPWEHYDATALVMKCYKSSTNQLSSWSSCMCPVHGGGLQMLPIVSGSKLLFITVCGVVFTVLIVRQWLNSSVTVMTISSEMFLTMRITFCTDYSQNDQLMTITWDLDLMTAHCVSEIISKTFWVECYLKTFISYFTSSHLHFHTSPFLSNHISLYVTFVVFWLWF